MKIGKSKIIISGLLASFGLSLVGVTFAQWAVTDNANSFSITITTSDDLPLAQGYYLTFASDSYSAKAGSAVLMSSNNENKAYATNLTIADGDQVRIEYYDGQTYDGNGTVVACA